ncbi:EF-P beta-lysylation protein EpmB [Flocculibacter collagenilyticus]|uniref:EF-P beta-lysylation protein EpmB n=1 Tax=Flocculibacter collagenilyticus TaxID=2744479 RepID=UPI0018F3E9BD|nr:EF-P beta-lysylation protein EpmB [Flocculibacter collagenilyticus]
MIHRNESSLHCQWQKELSEVITDPEMLLKILDIKDYFNEEDIQARKLFPLRVPKNFVARMEKGNPNDPLFLQVGVNRKEFKQVTGFINDPLQEQKPAVKGLLHKYKSRVLVLLKTGCAINCRYCFRRHFPYQENSVSKKALLDTLEYITAHPGINEVILSGGDPLMAKDDHIQWYLNKLEDIPHLKRIRIHTRLPVVIPSRITSEFVDMLVNTRLKAVVVTHINHANEMNDELSAAINKLTQAGITLLNQAVLLKDVNNNANALVNLSERLFEIGIMPYYLHLLDKVAGAAHFDVPEAEAKQLMQLLLEALPGFLVPKLVKEIGGQPSKTPINLF